MQPASGRSLLPPAHPPPHPLFRTPGGACWRGCRGGSRGGGCGGGAGGAEQRCGCWAEEGSCSTRVQQRLRRRATRCLPAPTNPSAGPCSPPADRGRGGGGGGKGDGGRASVCGSSSGGACRRARGGARARRRRRPQPRGGCARACSRAGRGQRWRQGACDRQAQTWTGECGEGSLGDGVPFVRWQVA